VKYLAFDLEIVKMIENGQNWKTRRPLGISCVGTMLSGNIPITWKHEPIDAVECTMTKEDLHELLSYMQSRQNEGYSIVTWNGLSFDFDVLAEESGQYDLCRALALSHIDMMFHFFCVKGYQLGLNTAAIHQGLQGKTEGIHGDLAPLMWQGRQDLLPPELAGMNLVQLRSKTLEYVGQDARTTLELAEVVEKQGYLKWVSKSGKTNIFFLNKPDGWLSVEKALELPEPDQSWMSNPKKRSEFLEWIGNHL